MVVQVDKKSYSELVKLKSYSERLDYLRLGDMELNSPRDISNPFYKSPAWQSVRSEVILRDLGSDMGLIEIPIRDRILVHHMNPISHKDIEEFNTDVLLNPENLITVSYDTHNIIHYRLKPKEIFIERAPGDTDLWAPIGGM